MLKGSNPGNYPRLSHFNFCDTCFADIEVAILYLELNKKIHFADSSRNRFV